MEEKPPTRDALLASATAEANGFYSQMAAIASGFLGGTLLFVEKIATHPSRCTLILLGFGWAALIGVLAMVVTIRYLNLVTIDLCLRKEWALSAIVDKVQKTLGWAAIALMIFGMCAIFIFGFANIWIKIPQNEVTVANEEKKNSVPEGKEDGPRVYIEKGIPYHNFLAPAEPAPKPSDSDSDKK